MRAFLSAQPLRAPSALTFDPPLLPRCSSAVLRAGRRRLPGIRQRHGDSHRRVAGRSNRRVPLPRRHLHRYHGSELQTLVRLPGRISTPLWPASCASLMPARTQGATLFRTSRRHASPRAVLGSQMLLLPAKRARAPRLHAVTPADAPTLPAARPAPTALCPRTTS